VQALVRVLESVLTMMARVVTARARSRTKLDRRDITRCGSAALLLASSKGSAQHNQKGTKGGTC
jgi:hypothetical protein